MDIAWVKIVGLGLDRAQGGLFDSMMTRHMVKK